MMVDSTPKIKIIFFIIFKAILISNIFPLRVKVEKLLRTFFLMNMAQCTKTTGRSQLRWYHTPAVGESTQNLIY